MQLITNGPIRILIPEKGYKLVNINTGSYHKKVYLGINDCAENYSEIIDEKYMNMDFVVEFDEFKENINKSKEQNNLDIDTLLLSIDALYSIIEPLINSNISKTSNIDNTDPLLNVYLEIYKRNLKNIKDIPKKYQELILNN